MRYILFGLVATNLGEAWRLAEGADSSAKILGFFYALPVALGSPLPRFHPLDLLIGLICGAGLRLAVYLKGKNAKKYRHNVEYGSARWGTSKDIAPFMADKFQDNVILTKTESLMMSNRPKNPANARNKNVLIIGGSGSGKTRFWLKPNLLQMHSSYVVTDPKGSIVIECGKVLLRNAVGFEFAKKRPVLIIQNDIGNKNSGTTIGLCLSSKCKPELPVRSQYDDLSVIRRPSDICAEQIKTIDKCRLEEYMGNVGPEVMKEVDHVVAFSLGMKETNDTEEFKSFQTTNNGTENMIQEQLAFWQNITFRITILESEKKKLDEEIESVLFCIEDSTYNAVQGYKVYKVLRDIRIKSRISQRIRARNQQLRSSFLC